MKSWLLLGVALLLAGKAASSAADTVELNGITCLPGEKLACLVLYQPALTKPLHFLLAEGESQFGFKLVAVEASSQRALIEKCGVQKYVRIGSAPEVIAKPATLEPVADSIRSIQSIKPTAADEQAVAGYLASEEAKRIKAGHPLLPSAVARALVGTGKNSNSGQSAATDAGNTGQNASASANASSGGSQNTFAGSGGNGLSAGAGVSTPLTSSGVASGLSSSFVTLAGQNSYANEIWYQESLSLEQSRILTAADVLAGNLTPFPRTPLTPPGTPAQLVGQEVYFANYIPGFQVTGFLNGF